MKPGAEHFRPAAGVTLKGAAMDSLGNVIFNFNDREIENERLELTEKNYQSWVAASFKGCRFKGRLSGCDFGYWPEYVIERFDCIVY
jgi:hypothetical protein